MKPWRRSGGRVAELDRPTDAADEPFGEGVGWAAVPETNLEDLEVAPAETRRSRRQRKVNHDHASPAVRSSAYIPRGASARPNRRRAQRGFYAPRATPAPTTTRQAEILNTALIAAPTDDEGVVVGRDRLSNSAVAHDQFTAYEKGIITSPAVIVLGVIGAGKSSLIKTVYVLRPIILRGRRCVVIDKKDQGGEGEYSELCRRLGGDPMSFRMGGGGTVLNPLDPRILDVVGRSGQFRLIRAMAERSAGGRDLDTWEREALRIAHRECLRRADNEGRTPLLVDLVALLGRPSAEWQDYSQSAKERLHQAGLGVKFLFEAALSDELAGLFDGPTSPHVKLDAKLTTFDVSQLPEDGPATSMVLAVAHSWLLGTLRKDRGKGTNFIVEEGWSMVSGPIARQMNANQMLARGLGLSNVAAMHHIAQVGKDSEAMSLLREPQTVHIYRQDRKDDIDSIVSMYGLNPGSAAALAQLEQGHHLLKIGNRAEIHVEHQRSELEKALTETGQAMLINQASEAG